MSFVLLSKSRRKERISDTSDACKVGVNRLGSRGEIFSSRAVLIESLLRRFVDLSSEGSGGVEDDGDMLPYGRERPDRELEGVLYGVSVGEGRVYDTSSSMTISCTAGTVASRTFVWQ
jgi:hypothetical protein